MGQNIALVFDLVMIIVLIFFIWRGFIRGFSGEIISFVGFFVAAYCAWNFYEPAVSLFREYLPSINLDDTVISIICGVVIFFGIEIVFALISGIISYVVKVAELTVTDHCLGVVIGIVKTFCIIVFVYAIVVSFPGLLPEETFEKSFSMKAAAYVWPHVRDFLTEVGVLDFSKLTGK